MRRESYEDIHGSDRADEQRCSFCGDPGWAAQWDCESGTEIRVCVPCALTTLPRLFADSVPGMAVEASIRGFTAIARGTWHKTRKELSAPRRQVLQGTRALLPAAE
jgi:hypothetical protein